ncbi:MAG: imidazole glycerol phosphate synthase subunit HisH [Candidatus Hydrogenedentota bacterium]
MILIVNYKMGNLGNVERAVKRYCDNVLVSENPLDLMNAKKIILPGVGAFGKAMRNLNEAGWIEPLNKAFDKNIPILGICLGLQLFFTESEESPQTRGLGWINDKIIRFKRAKKIPHIGWNNVKWSSVNLLNNNIPDDKYFYFVHSYYAPLREDYTSGITDYENERFTSVIKKDNLYATQFHPEKSHINGLKIIENFILKV